ncbi:MAG: methionyl-tRNA formyltransferase [Lachnospiraceae bacterium]|jgi:methionyl-tRNA formyltransferase
MKVIFMGTPDFAVADLKALHEDGQEILAVVTQPDRPKGRRHELAASPVKEAALEIGAPVLQPEKASAPEFIDTIRQMKPDIIVVSAFGQILRQALLDIPEYGCVNVHASLLPKYRGASPIQWAVCNGEEYSGVTTMLMDAGVDTGDILMQEKVKLADDETGGSLFDRLAPVGARLLIRTIHGLQDGTVKPVPQNAAEATTVKMIRKSDGEIDFSRPAAEIERHIRGFNPWPSAFTYRNGKLLKIWKARPIPESGSGDAESGTVTDANADTFVIRCGSGSLEVLELQPEGRRRMEAAAYLRGYPLKAGEKFGDRDGNV